jgi:NAD(P)-dependent dehydrogenase (short-subunit alcohol dehydrogenase family)
LFAAEGATVLCADVNSAGLESLLRSAGDMRNKLEVIATDVSKSDGASDIARSAAKFGKVHVLFNNAGIDVRGTLEETGEEDWDRIMSINVKSMFLMARALLPYFDRGGHASIVNTSSAAALHPVAGRPAYVASKGAVVAFTKALALDLAPQRIRVNCICPGAVETPLLASSFAAAPDVAIARKAVESRYLLGRLAQPEEIASAVLFLASSQSSYITGSTLAVDAGRTMH